MKEEGNEGKKNLQDFVVGDLPTLFYIPDFITDGEQAQLLDNIYGSPASKWKALRNRRLQNWGGIVHEKGLLPQDLPPWLRKYTQRIFEESGLFPAAINHVLINEYFPNQGIMPHQDGPLYFPVVAILSLNSSVVMHFTPHSKLRPCADTTGDEGNSSNSGTGEMEMDKLVNHRHPFSVLLMPRSLLIFKDQAYTDYLHGITECQEQRYEGAINELEAIGSDVMVSENSSIENINNDLKIVCRTSTRVSLTCRLVLKVNKNLFKF